MTGPNQLAIVDDYDAFVCALRARRRALGITQWQLDQMAGWPDGYTAKIELSESNPSARNARALGRASLPIILEALAVRIVLVPAAVLGPACKENAPHQLLSERGRKGGEARRDRLSPERRKEIARKAARARWDTGRRDTVLTVG